MKTPDTTTKAASSVTGQGAHIMPFSLPVRTNTASAEILARLISGQEITGMDAVFATSTTRLSAHIHYLSQNYAVTTETSERAVGCADGRIATITAYRLPTSLLNRARAAGADRWAASVRAARAALRAKAALAKKKAANLNAARRRSGLPSTQADLFFSDGEAT